MAMALCCFVTMIHKDGLDTAHVGWSYGIGWAAVAAYLTGAVLFAVQTVALFKTRRHVTYVQIN